MMPTSRPRQAKTSALKAPARPKARSAKKATRQKKAAAKPAAAKGTPVAPRHIAVGDTVRVERRYVVGGSLTSVSDEGAFRGVQLVGSTEHLLLDGDAAKGMRLIPIHSISEIIVVGATAPTPAASDAFDPSFA